MPRQPARQPAFPRRFAHSPCAPNPCIMGMRSRKDRRSRRFGAEESPPSTGQRCRLTAGRGNPTDSATERCIAVGLPAARVKRRCKRPPAALATASAWQTSPGARQTGALGRPVPQKAPGVLHDARSNPRAREMIVTAGFGLPTEGGLSAIRERTKNKHPARRLLRRGAVFLAGCYDATGWGASSACAASASNLASASRRNCCVYRL
jgi:hypothetical protein